MSAEEAKRFGCQTCPCELCGEVTSQTGTKRCDRCGELERRIEKDPALARKIVIRVLKDIEMEDERRRDRVGPPDSAPRTVGALRELLQYCDRNMPLEPVGIRLVPKDGENPERMRFMSPFHWGKVDRKDQCRPTAATLIRLQHVYDECAKQQVNFHVDYADGSRTWQIMVTSAAPAEECQTKEHGDLDTAIDVILERLALPPGERNKVLG